MEDMDIEEFGVWGMSRWYRWERCANGSWIRLALEEGSKDCVGSLYVSIAFENRKKGPSPGPN
jgi:hypothetical protein